MQRCTLRCDNVAGMSFSQRSEKKLLATLYNVVFTLCVCWVIIALDMRQNTLALYSTPLNKCFGQTPSHSFKNIPPSQACRARNRRHFLVELLTGQLLGKRIMAGLLIGS